MNREEFLIQASAYIGVAVGMRDGEMVIDGPHAIVELSNEDDTVFINTPDRTDFCEVENGDFTGCYKQLVEMADEGRTAFDKSVLNLRSAVAEHVAAINPSLCVSVSEDCDTCNPRATFYLHDTGIILYQMTMYGEHPDFVAHENACRDGFRIEPHKISKKLSQWVIGETGAIEVDEEGFLLIPNIHAFLGACLRWEVCEFVTTVHTSVPLPDIQVYKELTAATHRKFVNFQVL